MLSKYAMKPTRIQLWPLFFANQGRNGPPRTVRPLRPDHIFEALSIDLPNLVSMANLFALKGGSKHDSFVYEAAPNDCNPDWPVCKSDKSPGSPSPDQDVVLMLTESIVLLTRGEHVIW